MSPAMITAALAYHITHDALPRIFGPSYDVVGKKLAGYTTYAMDNLERVAKAAMRRSSDSKVQNGQLSMRASLAIIEESVSCENELMAEYFGGVLATTQKGKPGDDRAATFARMIGRLSSYQVRAHYIVYSFFKNVWNGKRLPITRLELRERASVYIPLGNYAKAMGCAPYEGLTPYLDHAITGLIKEGLLSDYYSYADSAYALMPPCEIQGKSGIVVAPTRLGLELFMWVNGEDYPPHQVFFREFVPVVIPGIEIDFLGTESTPVSQTWQDQDKPAVLYRGSDRFYMSKG
jgi:hypothetical protein